MDQKDSERQAKIISLQVGLENCWQRDFSHLHGSFFENVIKSALGAMWKLGKQSLGSYSSHSLFDLNRKNSGTLKNLESPCPRRLKQALGRVLQNLDELQMQGKSSYLSKINEEDNGESIASIFQCESVNAILRQQFQIIMKKVIARLMQVLQGDNGWREVELTWKKGILQEIYMDYVKIIKSCGSLLKLVEIGKHGRLSKTEGERQKVEEGALTDFKCLLSKLSGNSKAKLQLYRMFESYLLKLKAKEQEVAKWMNCSEVLQTTIKQQMDCLELQSWEKQALEAEITHLRIQLTQNEIRFAELQTQTQQLHLQLSNLKQPYPNEGYYPNPMYQRSQLQEKMLMEMIEIESDLLLGKQQIKTMTDSIVDLIKLSQNFLEDLQVSKYFLATFNRSVQRLTKDIKSLENYDLETILNLKEDSISLYDSEFGLEETRKSLSIFSEIDFDQKLSRMTEDDSLSIIHSEQ